MPAADPVYRGRFAPSPTGPLHLGSLIAALASYLDARSHAGAWLLRMEDLDPPREPAGAADAILRSLEQHGLTWDEEVLWQSSRHQAYADALADLRRLGLLFHCDCTRARLGAGGACRGRCAPRQAAVSEPFAVRITVPGNTVIACEDGLQGQQRWHLGRELGDFTLLRKDGLYAYQLAVTVDDSYQGISHVVRGSDLLDSTPRQYYLQRCLGLHHPSYSHIPVITNAQGQKLSKQNHAPALDAGSAATNLRQALQFLRQPPPPADLQTCEHILAFACDHWACGRVPGRRSAAATELDNA